MSADAPATYYVNLNYVCNERCVFCAADIDNRVAGAIRGLGVTLEDVQAWLDESPPAPRDQAQLAGGEPTLHPQLFDVVRLFRRHCSRVTLFTNGLRLARREWALAAVEAGVTRFEIALFGSTASAHDAVTRRRRSFEQTLDALRRLGELRREGHEFVLNVRLLVARQTHAENPAIVRLVDERVPGVDSFSLNRLILSDLARGSGAPISWDQARGSINESARVIRELAYDLGWEGLPLCVYEADNADWVEERFRDRAADPNGTTAAGKFHYFDHAVAAGRSPRDSREARVALPDACLECRYLGGCGRVESWYVRLHGTAALRPVRKLSGHEHAA